METLRIEKDVLKGKFLAMAVRADEEGTRAERALAVAKAAQRILKEVRPLSY